MTTIVIDERIESVFYGLSNAYSLVHCMRLAGELSNDKSVEKFTRMLRIHQGAMTKAYNYLESIYDRRLNDDDTVCYVELYNLGKDLTKIELEFSNFTQSFPENDAEDTFLNKAQKSGVFGVMIILAECVATFDELMVSLELKAA